MVKRSRFCSAADLLQKEADLLAPLSTGNEELDSILSRGIYPGSLTEIAGLSGCGKSQFCMQLTANTVYREFNVVYIDTERGSSLDRVKQIYRHLSGEDPNLDRVMFSAPRTLEELMIYLTQLASNESILQNTKLLIVDSVACFFRVGASQNVWREQTEVAAILSRIATQYGIAVVMTNHVTSFESGDGDWTTEASLGQSWSHRAATRIWVERIDGSRFISMQKCPWAATNKKAQYTITERGIEVVEKTVAE